MTATPSKTHEAALSDERLPELLPCPFCGGEAYLRQWSDAARVECTSHGPGSNDCGFTMRTYLNGPAAIAAWNRRTQPSAGEPVGYVTAEDFKAMQSDDAPDVTVFQEGSTYGCVALYATPPDQSKRVERLEAALRPFAEIAERIAAEHPGWYHDKFQLLVAGEQVVTLAPFIAASQALAAIPAPSVDARRDYRELVRQAKEAVKALDDFTNTNETEFTGWGDGYVPPMATWWRIKSGQALKALDEIRPTPLGDRS